MAISNSLYAGVTGLQTNQTTLDVVGNNLANSNTPGFKVQTANFQDLVYETLLESTALSGSVGGTNPMQVGFGATVGSIESNFQEGPLQSTGRALDLALQGNGFFLVNNGTQNYFTRAGAFDLDQNGYVIDAATGFRVQRFGTLGEATATTPAFQTPGNSGIRIPLGLGIPGTATANVNLQGNIDAGLAIGDASTTTAIQVFDTQGTQHTLSLTFTKTAANTFSVSGSITGGTLTGLPFASVTFNANGTLAGPATIPINVSFPPGLPALQTITLNLGTVGQATGLSQFGGSTSVAAVSQDGFAAGSLQSFNINQSGVFEGIFTNGQTLPLAQLSIATFANPGGLHRSGQNFFTETAGSGPPLIGAALAGGRGAIQPGALEGSNVDVATEFTKLIIAQRAYQINARTITASNEVLQTLANIIQ
jgi:flagellar hook protein FlgE